MKDMVDSGPENGVAARGTAGLDESTHPGHAACAGPSDAPPGSPAPRAESSALAKSATNGFVVDMTCDSDAEEAARETGETIIVLDSDEETPSGLGRGDVSADLILDRAVDEAPRDARKVGPSQNTQTLIQRRGRGLKRTKRRIDEGPRKKNMSDIEMMSRTDPRISAPGESGPGHACPDTSPATSIEARDTGHDAVSAVARDARTAGAARRDAPAEKPDRSEPSCSPLLSLTSEDEARPNDRSGRGTGSGMGSKEKGRTSAGEGSGEGGQGSKKGPTLVGGGSGAVGQGSDSAEDSEIDEIELDDEDSDDSGPEEVRRGEACVLCGVSAGGKGVTIQGSSGAEEGGVEFVFEDDVVEFAENAKDALHAHVVCTLMGRDTCQRTCMRARVSVTPPHDTPYQRPRLLPPHGEGKSEADSVAPSMTIAAPPVLLWAAAGRVTWCALSRCVVSTPMLKEARMACWIARVSDLVSQDAAQAWWASAMTGGDGDRAVRREHVGQMRQDTWPGKKCHFCQKKGAGAEKPLPHCKCPVESCDVYGESLHIHAMLNRKHVCFRIYY